MRISTCCEQFGVLYAEEVPQFMVALPIVFAILEHALRCHMQRLFGQLPSSVDQHCPQGPAPAWPFFFLGYESYLLLELIKLSLDIRHLVPLK